MRVLVTRPEPGASRTAALLRDRGHEPLLLPMTRIVGVLSDSAVLNVADAGAYALTSANALRSWQALGIAPGCFTRPIYSVGERTSKMAGEAGFTDVRSGSGDGAGLAKSITADANSGTLQLSIDRPLVYAAGRTRHGDFEEVLAAWNIPVRVVELYDIEQISYTTDLLNRVFLSGPADVVMLYSAKSAEILFRTFSEVGALNHLKNCRFICMSENVARAVPEEFAVRTAAAETPDEETLMKMLDRTGKLF